MKRIDQTSQCREEPDWESRTAVVCAACLRAALALADLGVPPPRGGVWIAREGGGTKLSYRGLIVWSTEPGDAGRAHCVLLWWRATHDRPAVGTYYANGRWVIAHGDGETTHVECATRGKP